MPHHVGLARTADGTAHPNWGPYLPDGCPRAHTRRPCSSHGTRPRLVSANNTQLTPRLEVYETERRNLIAEAMVAREGLRRDIATTRGAVTRIRDVLQEQITSCQNTHELLGMQNTIPGGPAALNRGQRRIPASVGLGNRHGRRRQPRSSAPLTPPLPPSSWVGKHPTEASRTGPPPRYGALTR